MFYVTLVDPFAADAHVTDGVPLARPHPPATARRSFVVYCRDAVLCSCGFVTSFFGVCRISSWHAARHNDKGGPPTASLADGRPRGRASNALDHRNCRLSSFVLSLSIIANVGFGVLRYHLGSSPVLTLVFCVKKFRRSLCVPSVLFCQSCWRLCLCEALPP